jgi:arginyl-tRNA synthetase
MSSSVSAGDKEALALWSRFRDFSIKRLEETYKRLNIHFDSYAGEAAVKPEKMEEAFKIMQEKNMLVQDKGAYLCDLEKYKLGKVVIKKAGEFRSDGSQLWHWFLTLILLYYLSACRRDLDLHRP